MLYSHVLYMYYDTLLLWCPLFCIIAKEMYPLIVSEHQNTHGNQNVQFNSLQLSELLFILEHPSRQHWEWQGWQGCSLIKYDSKNSREREDID